MQGSPPRILLLTWDFPPNRLGGMTSYYDGYVRHYPGFVHVLTSLARNGDTGDHYPEVTRIRNLKPFIFKIPFILYHTARLVRSKRVELVLCGSYSPFRHVAFLLNVLRKIPFLIVFHGNDILRCRKKNERGALRRRYARAVCRRCAGAISNSRFTAELVTRSLHIPFERSLVCYPGIHDDFVRLPAPTFDYSPDRAFRLVSVGRLTPRKGFDVVIAAVGILTRSGLDVTYDIVGSGDDLQRLHEVAGEHGVTDRVTFSGFAPDNAAIVEKLRRGDLFCMVSRLRDSRCDVEGFGIVYLEAGAAGRPCVASRSGGIPEAVVHDETGVLVEDPESAEQVADAIRTYIGNPDLLRRHGMRAYERAVRQFGWSTILDNHMHDVKRLLSARE